MYTLNVTETKNKAGKYHYQIIEDATGNVITERKSNREYVAATINGQFFFGRLDLIGKGDHGTQIKVDNGYRYGQKGWFFDPTAPKREHTPIAYKK